MKDLTLQAKLRDVLGKKTRFLRRQGITPVHLFGHGLKSLSLQCDTAGLQMIMAQAGTTRLVTLEIEGQKQPRSVFIREIQRDACTGAVLHVDLYQIRKTERMKVEVPIILTGEAPALKEKGRSLLHGITSLSVECLPEQLPTQIEVDLTPLEEIGQTIHVKDITLAPEIKVHNDAEQLVVKMSEAVAKRVEEEVEEEVEEVEEEGKAEAEAGAEAEQQQATE